MKENTSSQSVKYLYPAIIIYTLLTVATIWWKYSDNAAMENISKPLLMPVLIIFYLINKPKEANNNNRHLISALVFSMLGDIFLMPYFDNFIAGLLNFLLAHVFYILLFSNLNQGNYLQGLRKAILPNVLILLIYIGLISLLISNMFLRNEELILIVAVFIYATIISLMVFNSSSLYYNSKNIYTLLIFSGALFFMLSDSLIAINKFVAEVNNSAFYIMTTYCLAQFFIVYGVLKFQKEKFQK